MDQQPSPNPRPRRARRMREEDDATTPAEVPNADGQTAQQPVPTPGAAPAASTSPPPPPNGQPEPPSQQPTGRPAQAGYAQQQQQYPQPPPGYDMMQQLMQALMFAQQQQQQQFNTFMSQQAAMNQEILRAQVQAQAQAKAQAQARQVRAPKKNASPPKYDGKPTEDIELFFFSTEKFYREYTDMMAAATSEFVDMVFCNMGPIPQTFLIEVSNSMVREDGTQDPLTWALCKTRMRARFREKDYEFKMLTKLFELHPTGSQQEYTTKFLHLLSQLPKIPEFLRRWFYQQNLRSDTNAFISQNVPTTLEETIELAHRFEDSRRGQPQRRNESQSKTKGATAGGADAKKEASATTTTEKYCSFCKTKTHNTDVCRKKKAAEASEGKAEPPKNGGAR